MPNRIIREGIITSEAVNSLNWEAEIFYRRLLSVVDDFGRFDARPSVLRSALYPLKLYSMREDSVQRCLKSCEVARLVVLYSVNGKEYLEVTNFRQQVRSKKSKYPAPDEHMRSRCTVDANHVISKIEENNSIRELQELHSTCASNAQHMHTKTKTETETNKQENNAEGDNTVVCSEPPTAPAYPEMEDQHSEKRTERPLPARFGSETEHDAHDGRNGPQGASQDSTGPFRERLNDVRGMLYADNHADLGASPGAARFVTACLDINPSWGRTIPTAIETAAALEAYRSAQGRVTPRDMEMLRDYYASGLTHDRSNKAFWRPDSRRKFWECFGDVLTHADRWAKETRWKPAASRKKPKPEEPRQPEGPVVDTDTAAKELREWRKELGLGGDEG